MLIVLHLCSYILFVIGALEMFYDDDDDDDDDDIGVHGCVVSDDDSIMTTTTSSMHCATTTRASVARHPASCAPVAVCSVHDAQNC